jgi:hypothetical protein
MIASSPTSQNLVIFQKNRKIPFLCVGNCGNLWLFLFPKKENMTEYYFFKIVFTKIAKNRPKNNHSHGLLHHNKGVLSTASPLRFSLVGVPHMSLCVSSPPQASPARVTIALGASNLPVPIQLQVYVL